MKKTILKKTLHAPPFAAVAAVDAVNGVGGGAATWYGTNDVTIFNKVRGREIVMEWNEGQDSSDLYFFLNVFRFEKISLTHSRDFACLSVV